MNVFVSKTRDALGQLASRLIAEAFRQALREQDSLRIVLAAAPSQREMLSALRLEKDIAWNRITAFHMDEYIGLADDAPQRFANWLRAEFVRHVPLHRFEAISAAEGPQAACEAYATLLAQAPIDFVLLGIGTNGHLAFNDPPADLNDPLAVKVVTLDSMCREQQVADDCFSRLDDVPREAITLTVPTLLSGRQLFCCVPGSQKRNAVQSALYAPVSGECPATALRTHSACNLYLDYDSSPAGHHR